MGEKPKGPKGAGGLWAEIALTIQRLTPDAIKRLKEWTRKAGEEAGEELGKGIGDGAEEEVKKTATEIARDLERELNTKLGKMKLDLAVGRISRKEFAEMKAEAERAFNRSLAPALERARASGELTDRKFAALAKRLRDVGEAGEDSGKKTARAWDDVGGMIGGMGGMIAGVFAGVSITEIGTGLFNVNRQTESLMAQLKTAEGSEAMADSVFANLSEFAAKTPYELDQLTEAFTRFRGSSITMSEEVMTAFGDIAALKPEKTIVEFALAVEDALAGSGFERLAEFGIKIRKDGEKLTGIFRGQRVEFANNATELTKYLVSVGQAEGVQGAMSNQMVTMNGQLSNMQDGFAAAARIVGEEGFVAEMKGAIGGVNEMTGKIVENRAEVGFWVRVTIGAIKAIAATIAAPFRMLLDLGMAIGHGIEFAVSLMLKTLLMGFATAESSLNRFIMELNRLPGVNIGLFSAMQMASARMSAAMKDDLANMGDALSNIGLRALQLGEAYNEFAEVVREGPKATDLVEGSWGGTSAAPTAPAGKKGKERTLAQEVKDLKELAEARRLTAADTRRLAEIEEMLRKVAADATATAQKRAEAEQLLTIVISARFVALGAAEAKLQEVDLQAVQARLGRENRVRAMIGDTADFDREMAFQRIEALRNEADAIDEIASTRGLSVAHMVRLRDMELEVNRILEQRRDELTGDQVKKLEAFRQQLREARGEAMSFGEDFRMAVVSNLPGMADAFEQFFETAIPGIHSLGDAFGVLGETAVVASRAMAVALIAGLADVFRAKGLAKLADGIWPPNPAAIASGTGLLAASGVLRVLERRLAGSARGGAAASGGAGMPGVSTSAAGVDGMAAAQAFAYDFRAAQEQRIAAAVGAAVEHGLARAAPPVTHVKVDGFDPSKAAHIELLHKGTRTVQQLYGV
jgi:hypothetical protein